MTFISIFHKSSLDGTPQTPRQIFIFLPFQRFWSSVAITFSNLPLLPSVMNCIYPFRRLFFALPAALVAIQKSYHCFHSLPFPSLPSINRQLTLTVVSLLFERKERRSPRMHHINASYNIISSLHTHSFAVR